MMLIASIVAMGSPVTPDEARQKVVKFMNPRRAAAVTQNPEALRLVSTSHYKTQNNQIAPSYYVFNVGQGDGYVIAAADDRVPAVLGYSDCGQIDPENMPENMKAWLKGYDNQMAYLANHPEAAVARRTVTGETINPLLDTRYSEGSIAWDQKTPYNDLCPVDGNQHSLTGCVATAIAQIMYFWKYPAITKDLIPSYITQKRRFQMPEIPAGTPIDWANMLPYYTGTETNAQKQAVANLMILCGSAVQMNYTNEFSGAQGLDAALALRYYFDYDAATSYDLRDDYFQAEWNQRVYNELAAGRPVYYDGSSSGSGHAFVVDGYGGDDYFHVNWGWGGSSNNYFLLSILDSNNNSGSGATQSADGYSFDQGAIFGAQPNKGSSGATPVLTTTKAVILCDTTLTRANISESFKIKVGFTHINHMNDTYQFEWGVGLFDTEGNLKGYVQNKNAVELSYNYGYYDATLTTFTVNCCQGIDNGTFILKPISRVQGSETWYPDNGSDLYNIPLVINGNTLTLYPPVYGLTGTLKASGKKEVRTDMPITATITNKGTLWRGEIFLMQDGVIKGGRHVDIQPNDTIHTDFSIIPDSIGKFEYTICTREFNPHTAKYDYTIVAIDSIAVDPATTADLTIKYDVTNATNRVTKENVLKLKVSAKNNGASIYDNNIKADIYKDGNDGYYYRQSSRTKAVKIESGETVDISFDFENLEDANYLFIVSYLSDGQWKDTQTVSYTVETREPDPTPILSTTAKTLNAVYENRGYIVKSDTAIISIQVRNIGTIDYNDNIVVRLYQMTTSTGGPQVAFAKTPIQLATGADTTIVVQFPGLKDGATYFYWTYYVANKREEAGSQNTPIFTVKLEEKGYYLISDMNSWSTTDQSYPFEKLRDGKSWEITFKAPENDLYLKVAPASAYDHQDDFWNYLLCTPEDKWTNLTGTMVSGNVGAWLLPSTLNAETYTMRIVPSEMTYEITYTEKTDGIQLISSNNQNCVTIYGVNGNRVDEVNAANLQQRLKSLPKGLYIVRSGQKTVTVRNFP